ncbi:DUF1189 domain-containing protein [Haloimpatiens sp. FM7330]|uniref:DUF1189 domain-containing protein n=1 Tax=Haloimpatiens sp. FM7330 TaxID=3298610 RepID=UPI00362C1A71
MNFFMQLKDSITNFKSYEKISNQKFRKSFLYVIILSLILSIFISVKAGIFINTSYKEIIKFYNSDFPEFQIQNGILDVDVDMPYFEYDKEEEYILFIDTRENADEGILDDYPNDNGVFIFRDKIINKKDNGHTTSTFEFSELGDGTFEKKDIEKLIPTFQKIKVLIYALIFIGYFIFQILSMLFLALIYGVISLIVNKIMKTNLKFNQLYNMCLYALTLPTLIGTITLGFGVDIPYFKTMKSTIVIVYIILIMKSIKENSNNIDLDNDDFSISM